MEWILSDYDPINNGDRELKRTMGGGWGGGKREREKGKLGLSMIYQYN